MNDTYVASENPPSVDSDQPCYRRDVRRHKVRRFRIEPPTRAIACLAATTSIYEFIMLKKSIVNSSHLSRDDRRRRTKNGVSDVWKSLQCRTRRRRINWTHACCIRARWLHQTLWGLGAISLMGAMTRALDIGLTRHQVDFDVYLMGAKQVFTGHLYTSYLAIPRLPFTYPPISALVFIPFTAVTRVTAQAMWAALSTLLLMGFLYCSVRAVRPSWNRADVLLCSLVFTFPAMVLNPVNMTFNLGQINILLALLVLADLTTIPILKNHPIPRGVMTGIAAALKLTPLIFVPFLFATKQIRAGCVTLITFFICAITMLIFAPSESWSYWTKYVFDAHRVGGVVYVSNQSLRSTIYRFSHGHESESLLVLLVLAIGIVGLSTAVWAYRSSSPLLGILLCAVTGLLVSPITWAHHLVWVIPIILWLTLADDRPAFGWVWAALVVGLFWYGAIWRVPHGSGVELHATFPQFLEGNSYTLAMLLFVVGMIVMLALRHKRKRDIQNAQIGLGRDPADLCTAVREPASESDIPSELGHSGLLTAHFPLCQR